MNWAIILEALPTIVSLVSNVAGTLKTANPPLADAPLVAVPTAKASAAVADLQRLLNAVVNPQPPLVVDGWLGPKTEASDRAGDRQACDAWHWVIMASDDDLVRDVATVVARQGDILRRSQRSNRPALQGRGT